MPFSLIRMIAAVGEVVVSHPYAVGVLWASAR